jgi:predicted NBD/HSP70 family sugar kinase
MYVGIDIGGTHTRLGLFPALDQPAFTLLSRWPTSQSYQQQITLIKEALPSTKQIDGIGVSVGGRMARDGRSVLIAPNLPDYVGKPFASDLARLVGCPQEAVSLAHDPVCGLLGEQKFGCLRASWRCAYLTLSTGTGMAFHLSTVANALTASTEFSHHILEGNDHLCICGQVGCLETFTGGRQLEMRLGHSLAQVTDAHFWEIYCDKLALGLLNFAQMTRVETIAMSGAIILRNPFLLPLLQQKIDHLLHGATLKLLLATLEEDAPIIGAVTLLTIPAQSIIH